MQHGIVVVVGGGGGGGELFVVDNAIAATR
jgi:hypothetical protein